MLVDKSNTKVTVKDELPPAFLFLDTINIVLESCWSYWKSKVDDPGSDFKIHPSLNKTFGSGN